MKNIKRTLAVLLTLLMLIGVVSVGVVNAGASITSETCYTVLLLDTSKSMKGTPLEKEKNAAIQFCDAMLKANSNNQIAVIRFGSSVKTICSFTNDFESLEVSINKISASGGTNINQALTSANALFTSNSLDTNTTVIKNIVLCSDGLPETGATISNGCYSSSDHKDYKYANKVYSTAAEIMNLYRIYTLGFFYSISDNDLLFGRRLMMDIQNAGYYEVNDVEDLASFFNKITQSVYSNFKDHMKIGRDNNSFEHTGDNFDGIALNDEMFNKLCQLERENGYNGFDLQKTKDNLTWASSCGGWCYGFSSTMALIYANYFDLHDLGINESYFIDVRSPKTSGYENIGQIIKYYQLAKNTSSVIKAMKGVEYTDADTKIRFVLSNLVNLAKNAEATSEPVIVGFKRTQEIKDKSFFAYALKELMESLKNFKYVWYENWNKLKELIKDDVGHTMVCVGYEGIKEGKYHVLRMIDPNYSIDYTYFYIDKDFSNWHIVGGKYSNYDYWENIGYCQLSALNSLNPFIDNTRKGSKVRNKASATGSDAIETKHNYTSIRLMDYVPAKIYNEKGETLIFDGYSVSGDMSILFENIFDNGIFTGRYIEVENSETFIIESGIENAIFTSIETPDKYYSIDAIDCEKATIHTNGNLCVVGDNTKGAYYLSSSNSEADMVAFAIDNSSYVDLSNDDNVVTVTTDGDKSIDVRYYKNAEMHELEVQTTNEKFSASNYDNDLTNICPHCHKVHDGGFFDKIVGFFHKLIYRLTHLFG